MPPDGPAGATVAAGAHSALRAATDAAHVELDTSMSAFDLATREGYRRFLGVHAAALPPLEAALTAGGFAAICPGWAPRMAPLTQALDRMAIPMPQAPSPEPLGAAMLWGVAYVLEGSRLGGRMLAQTVRGGEVGEDADATAFLTDRPHLSWPAFKTALGAALPDRAEVDAAIDGARLAFDQYLDAVRVETAAGSVTAAGPHR
ncbi:biliverdin-producing heme oxygenase [uncultured Jannaschia sp.]|uniref:biliverdin-producing heme oxygenase n=1 Tax=uncultured Jannaschia sp. TaxID=293347 RepID=UPI0026042761|nr:biliverdin-producing heme oxygenase [uncultured Jannaschia sp.]